METTATAFIDRVFELAASLTYLDESIIEFDDFDITKLDFDAYAAIAANAAAANVLLILDAALERATDGL
jgi:hypothetical protein